MDCPIPRLLIQPMYFYSTAKNVAQEIAEKVCDSVAKKLEGKVMGTFDRKFFTWKVLSTSLLLRTKEFYSNWGKCYTLTSRP